jgi:hypothetical protein
MIFYEIPVFQIKLKKKPTKKYQKLKILFNNIPEHN